MFLYITHSPYWSIYGASTSLRKHLNIVHASSNQFIVLTNVSPSEYLLSIFFSIRHLFSGIYVIPLIVLLDETYDNYFPSSLRYKFSRLIRLIASFFSVIFTSLIILVFRPSFVHFNSHILFSFFIHVSRFCLLFNYRFLSYFHVRDFPTSSFAYFKPYYYLIRSFICIDTAVYRQFLSIVGDSFPSKNIFIVNNPFGILSSIKSYPQRFLIKDCPLNLLFVGAFTEEKGVKMILSSLKYFPKGFQYHLYFIGSGHLSTEIKSYSKSFPITILPVLPNLSDYKFYSLFNLLIRGDFSFRTGRTVYESLYSGCPVMLPSPDKDSVVDSNLQIFSDTVYFYTPNSASSLALNILTFSKTKKTFAPTSTNNYTFYLSQISSILSL